MANISLGISRPISLNNVSSLFSAFLRGGIMVSIASLVGSRIRVKLGLKGVGR